MSFSIKFDSNIVKIIANPETRLSLWEDLETHIVNMNYVTQLSHLLYITVCEVTHT